MFDYGRRTAAGFIYSKEKLEAPELVYPEHDARDIDLDVTLKWKSAPGAVSYKVFVNDLQTSHK